MPNQYRFMGRAASSATSVQPSDGRVALIFGILERKGGIAKLMLCEQESQLSSAHVLGLTWSHLPLVVIRKTSSPCDFKITALWMAYAYVTQLLLLKMMICLIRPALLRR